MEVADGGGRRGRRGERARSCLPASWRRPPLVLVHGATEDGRAWGPQLAALSDEFTVVAWDEPGAGRSSDVPPGFGLADYAGCLATLIESLELGPAHVAGISWGGTVVLELYRHHPGLVATLTTLLVWGERDARSPLGVARQFEAAVPDTKLVVIPDCGHVSNLERPEQLNEAVREFCRAHSRRRPES